MPLSSLIDQFKNQRVLVIGDVILDHYIRGSVSRTSPEAPVPILKVENEEYLPGGAANVARNLVALGAKAELVGLAANDEPGAILRDLFKKEHGLRAHLIAEKNRHTILKTRCVAQGQQMLRLDRESASEIHPSTADKALKKIIPLMNKCSGIILSDYGKGFLCPNLINAIIKEAKHRGLRVLVDPKGHDYTRYQGASAITPNLKEACEASGINVTDDTMLNNAAKALQKQIKGEAIIITRGPQGMSVFPRRKKPTHIPAKAREVYDVTGAGDTAISTIGLALFSGGTYEQAATLGNMASSIVVGLAGVACISADTLRLAMQHDDPQSKTKLATMNELVQTCRSFRQTGKTIVFTNGFFDLLHHGHIRLLEQARAMGDLLIVAINSDASTRRLKGDSRPILKSDERVDLLSSLPYVDYVVLFDDDTPRQLLEQLKPHLLVKGAATGTKKKDAVGHEVVEEYGGEVRFVTLDNEPRISLILERTKKK
jgi:D-beta-D-heptose 7-phosphate kinase / D-beta-D-heptose 1-phosphate adenosyltransferase